MYIFIEQLEVGSRVYRKMLTWRVLPHPATAQIPAACKHPILGWLSPQMPEGKGYQGLSFSSAPGTATGTQHSLEERFLPPTQDPGHRRIWFQSSLLAKTVGPTKMESIQLLEKTWPKRRQKVKVFEKSNHPQHSLKLPGNHHRLTGWIVRLFDLPAKTSRSVNSQEPSILPTSQN